MLNYRTDKSIVTDDLNEHEAGRDVENSVGTDVDFCGVEVTLFLTQRQIVSRTEFAVFPDGFHLGKEQFPAVECYDIQFACFAFPVARCDFHPLLTEELSGIFFTLFAESGGIFSCGNIVHFGSNPVTKRSPSRPTECRRHRPHPPREHNNCVRRQYGG